MLTKVIEADTIETAAQQILDELKEDPNTSRSTGSRNNVIYFDGWDGLGASAVLRAIARRLTPTSEGKPASAKGSVPAGLEFDQVMHIDCSKWESRRALQRAVAEQLQLPPEVMYMFDKQDEEDDFRGVAQGSRAELQPVIKEMYQHIQKLNRRILVIFHNGSNEEIDLANFCGIPLSGFSTNKVLWTFQGRFRLMPRVKVDNAMKSAGMTDAFLSADPSIEDPQDLWSYLVSKEAEEVFAAHKIIKGNRGIIDQPAQVKECFLYMLELCHIRYQSMDYDIATHGANYWICDGIIKQAQQGERDIDACDYDDGLWKAAEALRHEMQLDVVYNQDVLPLHWARCVERKPYWTSPTCGFLLIPTRDIFVQNFNKLCVLKISRCTFDFPSPPFLCCHNLRFLWLDHCQVVAPDGAGKEEDDIIRCFQRLWVLDVRYTEGCNQILSARMIGFMIQLRELNVVGAQDWDIGQLQGGLPNVRKLRVRKSTLRCSCSENDLFSEMNRMELLDFSHNLTEGPHMMSLCGPRVGTSSSSLETVIIDNSYRLKKISFRGCTNLKNILLSGYFSDLEILDISGTAVKTLDLSTPIIWSLGELHLLDCEKLCAITWPPEDKRKSTMDKLCIDTTRGSSDATRSSSSSAVLHGNRPAGEFDWYISVRDARLLVSLEPVYPEDSSRKIYVEISSPTVAAGATKNEKTIKSSDLQKEPVIRQTVPALMYTDVRVDRPQLATDEGDGDAPGTTWDASHLPKESCYMHIQDQGGSEQSGTITVPEFLINCAKILHVHDSSFITSLPLGPRCGAEWHALEWCRIERCPKLDFLFAPEHSRGGDFWYKMRIFWASQLPKARYIWKWSEPSNVDRFFIHLTSLHLDFCPRLIHVLPLLKWMVEKPQGDWFPWLETLEIMWCGDLKEVFPLDVEAAKYLQKQKEQTAIEFSKLKRIHLHELPKLHSICGLGIMMNAPELETVKIRGCWSLKRLPIVKKAVQCDCEKEWWDSLEWEYASQKKLYKPTHPKYYKKAKLLRGSVLR